MSNYSPEHVPTTYAEAREIVRKHGRVRRSGSGSAYPIVGLGYATTLEPRGVMTHLADPLDAPSYAVRYHNTDVVTFYRHGIIALDHGGWVSTTTCLRWNIFTPRELQMNAPDVMARRADADPRLVVSRVRWETVTDEWGTHDRPIHDSKAELFTTRHHDGPAYLHQGFSPATLRSAWVLAPSGIAQDARTAP